GDGARIPNKGAARRARREMALDALGRLGIERPLQIGGRDHLARVIEETGGGHRRRPSGIADHEDQPAASAASRSSPVTPAASRAPRISESPSRLKRST